MGDERNFVLEADLAVIGAGMCGVSAARHAAEAGKRVVVVEASTVGAGMTGRSAGHVLTGFLPSPEAMIELVGQEATFRLQRWAHKCKLALRRRWSEIGLGHTISDGYLLVGTGKEYCIALEQIAAYWRQRLSIHGARVLTGAELEKYIRTPAIKCALHDPSGFTIDPASLVTGLKRLCRHPNIQVCEQAKVVCVEDGPARYLVRTSAGICIVSEVFVCVGAARTDFLPGWVSYVAPSRTAIATTQQIPADIIRGVFPAGSAGGSDCSDDPDYWTVLKDGRLKFGCSVDRRECSLGNASNILRKRFKHLFPNLACVEFLPAELVTIDFTESGLPVLSVVHPSLKIAHGFSGVGLAAGYGAGQLTGVPWDICRPS